MAADLVPFCKLFAISYASSSIVMLIVGILEARRFPYIIIIIFFFTFSLKGQAMFHMGVVVIGRVGRGWDREKVFSLYTSRL
tara:strand:+ start:1009 stop:1254 length:246 start_codon:yes stop_codon:yes gene_type:complete